MGISNNKNRFNNVIERKGYDRLPIKHYAEPAVNEELAEYLGLDRKESESSVANPCNVRQDLLDNIGDDFRYVLPIYKGPEVKNFSDGTRTATFPDRGWPVQEIRWTEKRFGNGKGSYLEVAHKPFADITDPAKINDYDFPSADWFDYSNIKEDAKKFSDYIICIHKAGPDFIGNIFLVSCFKMDQFIIKVFFVSIDIIIDIKN